MHIKFVVGAMSFKFLVKSILSVYSGKVMDLPLVQRSKLQDQSYPDHLFEMIPQVVGSSLLRISSTTLSLSYPVYFQKSEYYFKQFLKLICVFKWKAHCSNFYAAINFIILSYYWYIFSLLLQNTLQSAAKLFELLR